jgi:hypothetical protein
MQVPGAAFDLTALHRLKSMPKTWTVVLEEDLTTGELILPLPKELLASQGWKEGDDLVWDVRTDGSIILTKHIL